MQEAPLAGNDIPVAIFELLDLADSGFIQQGTERLPEPIQLRSPSVRAILSRSSMPDPANTSKNKRIRYIYGCDEIEVEKQTSFVPNPVTDRIEFKDGRLTVAREGAYIGLYEYLKNSSLNASAKHRVKTVQAIYREIIPEENKKVQNEDVFAQADAMTFLKEQVIKSQTEGKVTYDEDKLDALCSFHEVSGETAHGKLNALVQLARKDPGKFVTDSKTFLHRVALNIDRAVKLDVLKFEGTRVVYLQKDKALVSYPANLKMEDKLNRLVSHLMSREGALDYEELLVEIKAAEDAKAAL